MGKKKHRSVYTSKGERRSVVNGVKEVRQSKTGFDKILNKLKAWRAGKNPWVTVPGQTSRERFVRVRANTVWGDPKKVLYGFGAKDE